MQRLFTPLRLESLVSYNDQLVIAIDQLNTTSVSSNTVDDDAFIQLRDIQRRLSEARRDTPTYDRLIAHSPLKDAHDTYSRLAYKRENNVSDRLIHQLPEIKYFPERQFYHALVAYQDRYPGEKYIPKLAIDYRDNRTELLAYHNRLQHHYVIACCQALKQDIGNHVMPKKLPPLHS